MKKELKVYYYNVGSCNGCDIELLAGVLLNESKIKTRTTQNPKEADLAIFTGILTKKIKPYFLRVLKQLPKRCKKIVFGSCAISGNVFQASPTFAGPVDKYLKPDLYVNGCPPKAPEYLEAVLEKLKLISKRREVGKYWRGRLKFDPKKCIGCLVCVYHCPAGTIKVYPGKKRFSAQGGPASGWKLSYDYEKCFFCGMCERKCPTRAIVLTHEAKMVEKNRRKFITEGPVTKGRPKAKIEPNKI